MFCSKHPNITTVLSCARCEVPICTSCSVPTPVGNGCALCSQSSNYSIFSISAWTIVKAYMTATLLAVLLCLVIVISKFLISNLEQKIQTIIFVWYTLLIISGFLIGQVLSLVSKGKKGIVLTLAPIYGVMVIVLGMLFSNTIVFADLLNLFGVGSVLIALAVSVRKF